MLRRATCLICVLLLAGCTQEIKPKGQSPAPEVAENAPSAETSSAETETPAQPANLVPIPGMPSPEETPAEEPAPEPKPKKGVIGQTTAQVVDAKEWLQKPGIEPQDGNVEGVDPFSRAASGYFTLAAQTSTLGLQQAVQHYRALNDKYPPYEEFMRMMQENRIEFTKLRWYEIYGYNEDTGKILILVDTVAKEEGP